MKMPLALSVVLTAVVAVRANDAVDRFHISCCTFSHGANYTTEEGVRLAAEAGLTRIQGGIKVPRDFKLLDYAAKYGITVSILTEPRMCGGRMTLEQAIRKYPIAALDAYVEDFNSNYTHSAISELNVCDEPSALAMPHLGELVAHVRERSKYPVYVNLYPNCAPPPSPERTKPDPRLGVEPYSKYLQCFCETIPIDYITYDLYPCYDDVAQQRRMIPLVLMNYKEAADAARRTGRKLQVVQQANTRPKNKLGPTANKIRFQAYAAMAFGTSELMWACWTDCWGEGWTNNMVDVEGKPTEQYYRLKEVNWEVRKIVPHYMKYRNVDSYFVDMCDLEKPLREQYQIHSIDRLNTGFFLDVEATDGSPLLIGDMVAKDPNSVGRALFIATCGDDGDTKKMKHTIRFKARGKVTIRGVDGEIAPARDTEGRYCVDLLDNRFLFVELAAGEH